VSVKGLTDGENNGVGPLLRRAANLRMLWLVIGLVYYSV